jgi:Cdc6-like AAA superfamily ATPase
MRAQHDALITDTLHRTGLLLYGRTGAGKTVMASNVCATLNADYCFHVYTIDCRTLKGSNRRENQVCVQTTCTGKKTDTILRRVADAFNECRARAPAVMMLDNVDALLATPSDDQMAAKLSQNKLAHGRFYPLLVYLYKLQV